MPHTNYRLTAAKVVGVAQAGRKHWKIENVNKSVLKTKGYHLEHNLGHGKRKRARPLWPVRHTLSYHD